MKKKNISFLFLMILGTVSVLAQEAYNTLMHEGNKQFDKGNYEKSTSKFAEAAKNNEKDFAAHYNLGNAFYKRKMYEEAKAEYTKAEALAKNSTDKAAALYNQGNAYMKAEQPSKAAEFYKKALKQEPYNEDIRKNYEIAMLKEKEQQQQNNADKGNGQGNGKNQNQEQEENPKGEKQNDGQGNRNNDGQGDDENPNTEPKEDNGSNIPKDLQNAILNRIEDKERETARRILNKNSYSVPQSNEKDW